MISIFDLPAQTVDIHRQSMFIHKLTAALPQPVQQHLVSHELSLVGEQFLEDAKLGGCHAALQPPDLDLGLPKIDA